MIWLLLILPLVAQGADQVDLYSAEAKVADESTQERSRAIRQALGKVMVKLTGDRHIKNRPSSKNILKKASSYAQQFRYRNEESAPTGIPDPVSPNGEIQTQELQRYIRVRFDSNALEQALRQAELPVWGNPRPAVLLWLAVERNGRRALISADTLTDKSALLGGVAARRGLALRLPLMDLQDQSSLNVADIWGSYQPTIEDASKRYEHDVIITGSIVAKPGGGWSARWLIYDNDDDARFATSAPALDEALAEGLQRTADILADRYAPVLSGDDMVQIEMLVSNVQSLEQYADVVNLLKQQDVVKQLVVNSVQQDQLLLDVWLRGDIAVFKRGLALANLLMPEPATGEDVVAVPTDAVKLEYRLR